MVGEGLLGADFALKLECLMLLYAIPDLGRPENVGAVRVKLDVKLQRGGGRLRRSVVAEPVSDGRVFGEMAGVGNAGMPVGRRQPQVADDGFAGGLVIIRVRYPDNRRPTDRALFGIR